MSQDKELMSEIFHAMAQPIMALRVVLELESISEPDPLRTQGMVKECLHAVDRLTQQMGMLRELASLEENREYLSRDLSSTLQESVLEMQPVATACNIQLQLEAVPCYAMYDDGRLRRACFMLLDRLLAEGQPNSSIHLCLHHEGDTVQLTVSRPLPMGLPGKLVQKLMQYSGARSCQSNSQNVSFTFPADAARHNAE